MLNWRPVVDYELREIEFDAECNLVQLRHQLDPSPLNARRVRDLISLLEEYGGMT
jgi:hypothetical protein